MNWTHYDHKDPIQAQEDMHEKIKENQLKLGWITLPSLNTNKDINVISNAHSANIIFGDCEAKLDEGLLKITNKNSEIGLIIHEQ